MTNELILIELLWIKLFLGLITAEVFFILIAVNRYYNKHLVKHKPCECSDCLKRQ